ncbi:MAG: ABC transporter permease [Bacteroidota bacterium]
MNLPENIQIGLSGLRGHRLRSSLTALGIIFGVSAVISMVSIGEGAKQEALDQIQLMGVNNIIVRARPVTAASFKTAKANFSPGLRLADARTFSEICPFVTTVTPQWEYTVTAYHNTHRADVRLIGTTPAYEEMFNVAMKEGTFLHPSHLENQDNVCVLGSKVKELLFRFEDAVGRRIKIGEFWFLVVGVTKPKAISAKTGGQFSIRDLNQDVYVPLTTAQQKIQRTREGGAAQFFGGPGFMVFSGSDATPIDKNLIDQITVKVKDSDHISEAYAVIRRILERRHFNVEDYEVTIPEELLRQSQQTQRIFNIVMGAIAGISLLVGGIGIMNIMLASVLERTKEIGIRRACGATQRDILYQFLSEAIFVSVVGGVIGIGLGYGLTKIITLYAGWRTLVSSSSILLAFVVSAAVGISFGIFPAKQAAEKDPIESLRYE